MTRSSSKFDHANQQRDWTRSAVGHFLTKFPVLSAASRQLDRVLTGKGKVLFVATCFFVIGAIHIDSPVYILAGACVSTLLVAALAVRLRRPRLSLRVSSPQLVRAGQSFVAEYKIANQSQHPAHDLSWTVLPSSSFEPSFRKSETEVVGDENAGAIAGIEKNATETCRVRMNGIQRGKHELPGMQIASSFPFNIVHARMRLRHTASILVAPRYIPLRAFNVLSSYRAEHAGQLSRSLAAGEFEFVGSREYQPGMPTRRWDHRAWARVGRPHVRQFEAEGRSQGALVIDSRSFDSRPAAEASLELALSIAIECQRQRFQLDWISIDGVGIDLQGLSEEARITEISRRLALVDTRISTASVMQQQADAIVARIDEGQLLFLLAGSHDLALKTNERIGNAASIISIAISDGSDAESDRGPVPGTATGLKMFNVKKESFHRGEVSL